MECVFLSVVKYDSAALFQANSRGIQSSIYTADFQQWVKTVLMNVLSTGGEEESSDYTPDMVSHADWEGVGLRSCLLLRLYIKAEKVTHTHTTDGRKLHETWL